MSVPATRSHTTRGRSSRNSSEGYLPLSRSSVASYAERGSVANGADRRTSVNRASTSHSSTAVAATTCWASTSRGLVGTCSASMAPERIRSTATAVCTRSPRCLGSSTPRETSPTWWPARPTRCRAEATEGGDSICTTRSTAPMSMPSSRLEVATTQGSRPRLRSSSISARCSLDTDPWCALAMTTSAPSDDPLCPISAAGTRADLSECGVALATSGSDNSAAAARSAAISLKRAVSRSASRRELAKTMVERCCSIRSTTRSSTCGQIDPRRSAAPAADPSGTSSTAAARASSVMSSTGTTTLRSHSLVEVGATTSTGREPPRKRATSSIGRTVADRPMRWAGCSSSSSRRSSDTARWAPRLVPATACTSSTITVSTPRSDSRAWEVSIRNNDSGVVIRMSGGVVPSRRRSAALVSPDRRPTVMSGAGTPSRSEVCRMPVSGARRLRSTSTASALSGET